MQEHQADVVNISGQYSIWPAERPLPPGWRAEGFSGERQACLDHIAAHWTTLTPRTLHPGRMARAPSGGAAARSEGDGHP